MTLTLSLSPEDLRIFAELEDCEARLEVLTGKVDPVSFAKSLGFTPDPWQAEVLCNTTDDLLLNIARQSGKSSVAALKALYVAVTVPASLTLLISPSDRQSLELFRKVRTFYNQLPDARRPRLVADRAHALEFEGGSRIVSLPNSETTIRGYSAPRLVIFDESGDVPDEMLRAVRPMQATVRDKQLIAAGTPKGKRGWYWETWQQAEALGFKRFEVRAADNPRIPAAFLEKERKALGAAYPQEYECEFLAGVFGRVYGGFDEARNLWTMPPRDGQGKPWECHHHALGIDYGFNDACGFTVMGYRDGDPTVYVLRSYKLHGLIPSRAAEEVRGLEEQYHFEKIVGDTQGLGKGYAEEARRRFTLPIEPAEKLNKRGYIDLFNGAMAEGLIKFHRVHCAELVEEFYVLPWDERREKEAEGYENHCTDSCLYGWRAMPNYHEREAVPPPAYGSPAWERAEEKAMVKKLEDRIQTDRQQPREWWEQYA